MIREFVAEQAMSVKESRRRRAVVCECELIDVWNVDVNKTEN